MGAVTSSSLSVAADNYADTTLTIPDGAVFTGVYVNNTSDTELNPVPLINYVSVDDTSVTVYVQSNPNGGNSNFTIVVLYAEATVTLE
jgi:hypothetical protein